MLPILISLHVFITLILILLVLLQKPKGDAALSASNSAASHQMRFSFITKFTMVVGLVFLLNSILLSVNSVSLLNQDVIADHNLNSNQDHVVDDNTDVIDMPFEK